MLLGTATDRPYAPPPSAQHLFGLGVHHAVRARFCIERGRWWQAEYWISAARDQALTLGCRQQGLETGHGRGFDRLSAALLGALEPALVRSLDRAELLRALNVAVDVLLREAAEVREMVAKLERQLRDLTAPTFDIPSRP